VLLVLVAGAGAFMKQNKLSSAQMVSFVTRKPMAMPGQLWPDPTVHCSDEWVVHGGSYRCNKRGTQRCMQFARN